MTPRPGEVYVARRSRSGRRWRVRSIDGERGQVVMVPLGDDVRRARSAKTGKWQGGVRVISVDVNGFEQRWARC